MQGLLEKKPKDVQWMDGESKEGSSRQELRGRESGELTDCAQDLGYCSKQHGISAKNFEGCYLTSSTQFQQLLADPFRKYACMCKPMHSATFLGVQVVQVPVDLSSAGLDDLHAPLLPFLKFSIIF